MTKKFHQMWNFLLIIFLFPNHQKFSLDFKPKIYDNTKYLII